MISGNDIEAQLKALKPVLTQRFHVAEIGYFGSFADGTQTETSDVDILVDFSQPLGWEFMDLIDFLEKSFQRKVDLVPRKYLKEGLRDQILDQVVFV